MVDVEDDVAGLSGLDGKAAGEDVVGVLGLDAWDPEVVDLPPAELALGPEHGDDGDEPDSEHPERVTGAALTEAVEERGHGADPPGR